MKTFAFWFIFHWSLFLKVQLTISQPWFRSWLVACSAPSHYLNQGWPSLLMHMRQSGEMGSIPRAFFIPIVMEFMTWLSNCFHIKLWDVITHPCPIFNGIYALLNWVIIGSDNGLSPVRRQAIIWTNAEILLIGPPETIFNEILIKIHAFLFTKIHLKMSSGKWRPFCLCLNVLRHI